MLGEEAVDVTVKIVSRGTRQGRHEAVIELYEAGALLIGGVMIESATGLSDEEVTSRAIKQFYAAVTNGN